MGKICRYCSLDENGDIPDYTKDILFKEFDHGRLQIQIGNSVNDFGVLITEARSCFEIFQKDLKLNFCPMCGRNLKEARKKANE